MANIDVAVAELDEMTTFLKGRIEAHGFNNDNVIWLIKAWTKVVINLGLTNELRGYWVFKREPPKIAGKRSMALMRALDDYSTVLESSKTTTGDFYIRARDAMVNFVWDYRKQLSGNLETDFVHRVQKVSVMRDAEIMQEEIMNMDRSL
jgi:hypothetical protein